jgi:hypothetical protein
MDMAEDLDGVGNSVYAVNFGKTGQADLANGVPSESVGVVFRAGSLNVLYGGAAGLTSTGNQLWNQESPGMLRDATHADTFGDALPGSPDISA